MSKATEIRAFAIQSAPGPLRGPLQRCAQGTLPPNVALMHLLAVAQDAEMLEHALAEAIEAADCADEGAAERLRELVGLWRRTPHAWDTVKSVIAEVDPEYAGRHNKGPSTWAAMFDRLAEIAPEAGVALYSLGRSDLLEEATASVRQELLHWGLLGRDQIVLDIGCGIGRMLNALAGDVRMIVGVDISPRMLAIARQRCADLDNVHALRTDGRDLALFADGVFDLVCAIDVFPYLVDSSAELAVRHVEESWRVLKPGGSLMILNYSYRGNPEADREEVARLAASAGFEVARDGTCDFAWWDALCFHLRRTG
jgi:SAM-dependent methyltransferase